MLRLLLLTFTLLLLPMPFTGSLLSGDEPSAKDDRTARIDALFAPYDRDDAPGCAAMVIRDGRIVHAKGYGMADLKRKVPMGPEISTRMASVSKQFTAMAIMILAEQGKLDFDDPASRYVPELSERYGDKITVRHLLNHTSGLPDYYGAGDQFPSGRMPVNEDGAAVFKKWGEPRFAPNEKYEYSNPGYEMLGLIVERVSKKSFAEFMDAAIFEPLDMKDSLVLDHPEKHSKNRAYSYRKRDDEFVLFDDHPLNLMFGAGGVYTTLEDMYKWDQALYTENLVKKSTLKTAFTSARLNNGKRTDYGFGWMIETYKGHRRLAHGGGWMGFRTGIARYIDAKLTVVVFTNRGDIRPKQYVERITDLYLEPKE